VTQPADWFSRAALARAALPRMSAWVAFQMKGLGLAPIQGLDLGFLVHRKHHGVFWGIEVETDDVFDLLGEVRIIAHLEGARQMGLEPVRLPDLPYGKGA